ncbi:MAG: LysE/ArgO family amino acid transporter [Nocardioidaceae bacterium]
MSIAFVIGFVTSAGLITAIGAQNAFVLRQGIRREYVVAVVIVCASADALLIGLGVAGLGEPLRRYPIAVDVARYAGGAFLLCYGVLAARRAWRPGGLVASESARTSLRAVVLTGLGFTFLNPHVYLDTVLLLGSIANQYRAAEEQWWFGAGAIAGSVAWFTGLGWGARVLAPIFARPRAWQVLDGLIAAMMVGLGGWLVVGGPAA